MWACAFPSLPEGASLFLHCRKALGNVLLHCSTTHVHVGMRFSFTAGRRFAFPSLPEGASLFRPTLIDVD